MSEPKKIIKYAERKLLIIIYRNCRTVIWYKAGWRGGLRISTRQVFSGNIPKFQDVRLKSDIRNDFWRRFPATEKTVNSYEKNGYKKYCMLYVDNNEYMPWLKNKELIKYIIINKKIINNICGAWPEYKVCYNETIRSMNDYDKQKSGGLRTWNFLLTQQK